MCGWLGGVTIRASDLRSSGHGFDSRFLTYLLTEAFDRAEWLRNVQRRSHNIVLESSNGVTYLLEPT